MGYELYITRAQSWLDNRKFPISKDEWEAVVAADAELKWSADEYYDRKVNGRVERTYAVHWTKHPDNIAFLFLDGAIEIKNPDDATIRKMVVLAGRLNAKVLGQEDEEYGADGAPLPR